QSGSDVFVRVLPEVRDRFHYRPDATSIEQQRGDDLASLLHQAGSLLSRLPAKTRPVTPFTAPSPVLAEGKKDRVLKLYQGDPQPPALALTDLAGKPHNLQDYRNKVVLVNFWASWCPPCVHEMPSKVKVNFPVLLDHDGAALKRWGVFAFPTSYVIDKQGIIRYALFGSVEWDSEEILATFSALLREP
ncbi:MAG: hypothetical protein AMJ55_10555, partial [Gammaproteobacteria bacterium SG8_15]